MKKLLLIILSLVTLLSFTACNNNAVVYNPEKPYWLDEKDFGNKVVTVNETAVYNVTYKPFESPNENVICEFADNNTFTMTVVDTELDGVKCYLMTSTCIVSGSYTATANSEKMEFTDTTVNKTWFTWNSGFEFIKSEQEAESTLPTAIRTPSPPSPSRVKIRKLSQTTSLSMTVKPIPLKNTIRAIISTAICCSLQFAPSTLQRISTTPSRL